MNRIQKRLSLLVLSLLIVTMAGWPVPSAAQEAPRTFTNKQGQEIEAILIGVEGPMAEIRRVADKGVFKIPIASLSFEDQVWIAEWVKQAGSRPLPGEWGILRVDLPNPLDVVDVLGMEKTIAATRMGSSTYELNIPDGAWVKLRLYASDGSGDTLGHLIRYNGAKRWQATAEGRLLLLARDGGEAKVHGITLPYDYRLDPDEITKEQARFVRRIDKERLAESISVEVSPNFEVDTVNALGTPVAAITSKSVFRFDSTIKLTELSPKAVEIYAYPEAFDALKSFDSLEALSVKRYTPSSAADPADPPADPIDLVDLPAIRDLTLSGFVFSEALRDALSKVNRLRLFEFLGRPSYSRPTISSTGTVMVRGSTGSWEGIDASQSLESLHISSGVRLKAADVAKLSKLKSLRFGTGAFSSDDPDLPEMAELTGLLHLIITTTTFPKEVLNFWAESGGMKEVRQLSTNQPFNFGSLPKLEVLALNSSRGSSVRFDLSQLAQLPNLRYLYVSHAGQREMDGLATLTAKERLEVARFRDGTFHDMKVLEGFTGIRRLELSSHSGSLYELDAAAFPKLEYLSLTSMRELETLTGIAGHPSLQGLRLTSCSILKNLGAPAPNETLRMLYLSRCPQLSDFSAFDQTTGLNQLQISDCDALAGPLRVEEASELEFIYITGCELMETRRSGGD